MGLSHLLVPFFVTSLPFTKIMSIEDNSDTRDFIRRLPVSKYLVVFSRAVFILFMLLISSISLFVIQTIGFNVVYNTDMLIKIASIILIFLLYFMLQLGVFYKYSYHASQSILVIISFAVIVLGFITENIDLVKYFLADIRWDEDRIRSGLQEKLEAMVKRELYTRYKTAGTPEEREKARQEYLEKVGIPENFRW